MEEECGRWVEGEREVKEVIPRVKAEASCCGGAGSSKSSPAPSPVIRSRQAAFSSDGVGSL